MLESREIATILAALQFWREEMCPHSVEIMRPYFETVEMGSFEPLTAEEIRRLSARLKAMVDPGQM